MEPEVVQERHSDELMQKFATDLGALPCMPAELAKK